MPITDDFIRHVAQRKTAAENIESDLKNQITVKEQLIREADPQITQRQKEQWQAEMTNLQNRYVTEPEAAVESLCDEIQKETGLSKTEVSKRNTDAGNLKGMEWAEFILADEDEADN